MSWSLKYVPTVYSSLNKDIVIIIIITAPWGPVRFVQINVHLYEIREQIISSQKGPNTTLKFNSK